MSFDTAIDAWVERLREMVEDEEYTMATDEIGGYIETLEDIDDDFKKLIAKRKLRAKLKKSLGRKKSDVKLLPDDIGNEPRGINENESKES